MRGEVTVGGHFWCCWLCIKMLFRYFEWFSHKSTQHSAQKLDFGIASLRQLRVCTEVIVKCVNMHRFWKMFSCFLTYARTPLRCKSFIREILQQSVYHLNEEPNFSEVFHVFHVFDHQMGKGRSWGGGNFRASTLLNFSERATELALVNTVSLYSNSYKYTLRTLSDRHTGTMMQ